jgi:hypothetical protein
LAEEEKRLKYVVTEKKSVQGLSNTSPVSVNSPNSPTFYKPTMLNDFMPSPD